MSLFLPIALFLSAQAGTAPFVPGQRPALPAIPSKDKVIAIVDGVTITAGGIEKELWDWHASQVMEELIVNIAVESKAKAASISVTDVEIQKAYDQQLSQLSANLTAGQDIDSYLHKNGGSKTRLWTGARREVLINKLVLSTLKLEDFASLSTIAIRAKSEAIADVTAAVNRANEAYAKLQKGEAWSATFNAYNVDSSQPNFGLIGYVLVTMLPKSTQAEIATLKPGQVTKPVQTPYGFQIFRLEHRAKDGSPTEVEGLKNQFVMSKRTEYIDALLKSAKIQRFP